jgi:lauroyl/myristoyl acyltransferase
MMWSYYFRDLPLLAWGLGADSAAARLLKSNESEISQIRSSLLTLCNNIGRSYTESEIKAVIEKSLWVKIMAESDVYLPLKMTGKKIEMSVIVEGLNSLTQFLNGSRPIVLLSAHTGSFNLSAIPLLELGIPVYVVARQFAFARDIHPAKQLFMWLHHKLLTMRFPVRYIYTDFVGKIDRAIMSAMKGANVIFAYIDVPRFLYPYKRVPVSLFGRPSSLPSGFILWARRKHAIFCTAWSTIEKLPDGRYRRSLKIHEVIPDGADVNMILRVYAERFSEFIAREPWQWMELPILCQYDESVSITHRGQ